MLSAYPILGEGPGRLSPFKARMAMAVRTGNAHWKMREIVRRHWLDLAERHGIVTLAGGGPVELIDDLVARTPAVVEAVRGRLPAGYPEPVAESIFGGLAQAAEKLAA